MEALHSRLNCTVQLPEDPSQTLLPGLLDIISTRMTAKELLYAYP